MGNKNNRQTFKDQKSAFPGSVKGRILPEAYFKSLKEGDVLNDEPQNPLVWHISWEGNDDFSYEFAGV